MVALDDDTVDPTGSKFSGTDAQHQLLEEAAGGAPVRDFRFSSAFALAFSDLSPIVGIYSVFGISIVLAGPGWFWALPIVLVGQLLVAGVFGDLVSKWPYQGSVYAWSRELIGPRYGWFTSWAYMWGLTLAMSVLGLAAAGYLAGALGLGNVTKTELAAISFAIILCGSVLNSIGGKLLQRLLYLTLACELIASVGVGTILFFFHRTNSFSMLFHGAGNGGTSPLALGPMLGAVAFVGYSFVGFESAGSIAEEVREARRVLPKAIVLALLAAGLLVMWACLGISLSMPDLAGVMSGKVADPISTTLELRLGSGLGRAVLIMLTIGFTASMIAVQAAVTRAIWATARDGHLPGKRRLGQLSGPNKMPRAAIAVTFVVSALLPFISFSKIYTLLLSFATAGFFISYALPIWGLIYVRFRGRWTPGPVSMGRFSGPVTVLAGIWIVFESINVAWPRNLNNGVWYLNWGLILMSVGLGLLGLVLMRWVFRDSPQHDSATVTSTVESTVVEKIGDAA